MSNATTSAVEILEINSKYFIKSYTSTKGHLCAALMQNTPKARFSKEKEVCNYRFQSENARFDWVLKQTNKIHENERDTIRRKMEAKKAADAAAKNSTITVGTIFSCSWGYDQTNVDFYEVVAMNGRKATLRPLSQKTEATGRDSGNCLPIPGKYYGQETIQKIVQFKYGSPSLSMDHGWCGVWNGKSCYCSSGH